MCIKNPVRRLRLKNSTYPPPPCFLADATLDDFIYVKETGWCERGGADEERERMQKKRKEKKEGGERNKERKGEKRRR